MGGGCEWVGMGREDVEEGRGIIMMLRLLRVQTRYSARDVGKAFTSASWDCMGDSLRS